MAIDAISRTVSIGNLQLDPLNSRIPPERRSNNQRQLLHALLEHEDVKGLASSISKLGLFPSDRLIVEATGRQYTVLEGNRRLAAIKLLLNPELAPTDTSVKYFRRLASKANLQQLGKVDVSVFPDRISAAPIIAALHTGSAKKRWTSLQQSRFYRELIDEGQTPNQIAEDLGISLADVRGFLRAEKLYRIALTLDHSPDVRSQLEDSNFPLTTLERFLESTVARKFLGVELDDQAGFRGVVHPERFRAVLQQVSQDIATKKGLTREVNNEKGFNKYIADVEGQLPKTKVRGSFSADSLLEQVDSGAIRPKLKVPISRTASGKPPACIVSRGVGCTSGNERVRAIFNELKTLKVATYRNAVAVLLRVLIEISLWDYLVKNGHHDAVCNYFDKDRKKRRFNQNWTPSLRELISYSIDKHVYDGMPADGYKSIRTLTQKNTGDVLSVEGFNEFTHNRFVAPMELDLRILWNRALPMLEFTLHQR